MWGLFIHFVGDVVTSLLVLGVGLIYHFYPVPEHPQHSMKHYWVNYADPVSSILSVIIILLSAWPLVKSCSWILLQTTALDLSKIREDIRNIDGVVSVHELHIWELVDSLVIASVHVVVRDDMQAHDLVQKVKKVLHKYGVHSTTIQPEFFSDTLAESKQLEAGDCVFPEGNCVQDCQEERCCPPKRRATLSAGDIVDIEVVTSTSHGSHSPIPTGIN
jgi:zinc transporter 1